MLAYFTHVQVCINTHVNWKYVYCISQPETPSEIQGSQGHSDPGAIRVKCLAHGRISKCFIGFRIRTINLF